MRDHIRDIFQSILLETKSSHEASALLDWTLRGCVDHLQLFQSGVHQVLSTNSPSTDNIEGIST